jgi:hypothetical protein
MVKMKKQVGAVMEPRRKTTHALPVSILHRLQIYAAVVGKDQQDIVAQVLDKHLPQNPLEQKGTTA